MSACRSEGLCDAFIEGRFRHVERVRSLVQIMDNDWAGFEGPKALTVFAFCSSWRRRLMPRSKGREGKAILCD